MPVVGVVAKAKEAQQEPSLVGDTASGTSDKDAAELEAKGKVGASKMKEQEDLFASGSEEDGGDGGAKGEGIAPAGMAN